MQYALALSIVEYKVLFTVFVVVKMVFLKIFTLEGALQRSIPVTKAACVWMKSLNADKKLHFEKYQCSCSLQ